MAGLNYVIGTKKYRHGYQGQFAETDPETGTDDFDLRMYDSRIGRWTAPDPAGQFHSPYVGMGNNPVSNVDADGSIAEWLGSFLGSIGIGKFVESMGVAGTYYAPTLAKIGSVGFNVGLGAASTAVQAAGQGPGQGPGPSPYRAMNMNGVNISTPQNLTPEFDPFNTPQRHAYLNFTIQDMMRKGVKMYLDAVFSVGGTAETIENQDRQGAAKAVVFPIDKHVDGFTKDVTVKFKSEMAARNTGMAKLGKRPIQIEQYKWRSANGKYQFRAKPIDFNNGHVHLEKLEPKTGRVLENFHLAW